MVSNGAFVHAREIWILTLTACVLTAHIAMEGAAAAFRRVHPREFYQRFVAQGVRPDGRQLDASRQTTISTGKPTWANLQAAFILTTMLA